jgi:hypothetical protein
MASVELNLPEVVSEVQQAFMQYEAALVANDVNALNDFFVDAAFAVRYGLAEHSYGIGAIRAYRKHAAPVDPRRTLNNTIITTIGRDAASVSTEFTLPGKELIGRQTQTWARCSDGWKILAAHVSAIPL